MKNNIKQRQTVNGKQRAFLYFLIFLSAIFLFIEYFHIDSHLDFFDNCPICRWEKSVFAPEQLYLLVLLLTLVTLFRLATSNQSLKPSLLHYYFNSRAPPRPASV